MENIEKVEETGDGRTIWTISAPGGQSVRVETKIAEEREHELVAWRSVKGSEIDTEGRVAFRDAPGGRGTLVDAIISSQPPAGALGRRPDASRVGQEWDSTYSSRWSRYQ